MSVRSDAGDTESLLSQPDGGIARFDGQLIGFGLETLERVVAEVGLRRPMLVLDPVAARAARFSAGIEQSPIFAGRVIDGVRPNPTMELARSALDASKGWNADGVVAIGGGSCIDLAKALAVGLVHANETDAVFRGNAEVRAALPIIAVPTSAGSGSQATRFGVLYVDGRKRSLDQPDLRPAAAVLDPRFVSVMPAKAAAVSGLDALCQCVESVWACRATDTSKRFAIEGGRLMFENLVKAVRDRDPGALRAVTAGAHLSGSAINLSRTTAAHAYSYALTQRHGIPHGLAVAHALGWVARWNATIDADSCEHPDGPVAARRLIEEATAIMGCQPGDVRVRLSQLCSQLGLPPSMPSSG
ncbi:MAG: iron-containing alcohol dehydrogenase, partial [Planctomycetota bacterium]